MADKAKQNGAVPNLLMARPPSEASKHTLFCFAPLSLALLMCGYPYKKSSNQVKEEVQYAAIRTEIKSHF